MTVELAAADAQAADTAVAFACDARYLPYAAFAAAQIAALNPGRSFDICLCAEEALPELPGLAGLGLRRCRVATGRMFDGHDPPHERRGRVRRCALGIGHRRWFACIHRFADHRT